MDNPEGVIRELFARYSAGDRNGAVRLFAEDAVFAYPGPGPLHGDYEGRPAILRLWALQDRLCGGVFRPTLLDLVAGERNAFLLVRAGDQAASWRRVVVYEIRDALITGARVFEDDPVAAASYFHHA